MADNYRAYLESMYSPKTFARKLAYLRHNFGKFFDASQTVLEIGPGLGEFLAFLSEKNITDVDIVERDSALHEYLRSKFKISSAHAASLEDLPANHSFLREYDRIFLLQVLEHAKKSSLVPILKTLYSRLKPGGAIIITVPNGGNPLSTVERYSDITHETLFSENSLRELVQMCDLPVSEAEVQGYRIPPSGLVNLFRIAAQKTLQLFMLGLLIVNGGVIHKILHPNISLIIWKR